MWQSLDFRKGDSPHGRILRFYCTASKCTICEPTSVTYQTVATHRLRQVIRLNTLGIGYTPFTFGFHWHFFNCLFLLCALNCPSLPKQNITYCKYKIQYIKIIFLILMQYIYAPYNLSFRV